MAVIIMYCISSVYQALFQAWGMPEHRLCFQRSQSKTSVTRVTMIACVFKVAPRKIFNFFLFLFWLLSSFFSICCCCFVPLDLCRNGGSESVTGCSVLEVYCLHSWSKCMKHVELYKGDDLSLSKFHKPITVFLLCLSL